MGTETAEIIFYIGAALGILIWFLNNFISLRFFNSLIIREEGNYRFSGIKGEINVDKGVEKLKEELKAKRNLPGVLLEISEIESNRIKAKLQFMNVGTYELMLKVEEPEWNKTKVSYFINLDNVVKKWKIVIFLFQFLIALPVLILIDFLIYKFALLSDNPSARAQVIQLIQQIHVLWPPYLFIYLVNYRKKGVEFVLRQIVG